MYVGRGGRGGGSRGVEVNLPPVIIFRNILNAKLAKLGNRTSDEEKSLYKLFG